MTVTRLPRRCALERCSAPLRPDLAKRGLRREVVVVAGDGRSFHAGCYAVHLEEGGAR